MTDDEVEKIRRIYWYEGIRLATGATTAYALERLLEPEGFGRNQDDIPIHRNKWATYKAGIHTPNEALVARVNLRVRGSSREINHVLWKVLRQRSNVSANFINWLRQLEPELQMLVIDDGENVRNHGWRQTLEKIERRASLDALACLTILTCLNSENGNLEQASELARSTHRVLLILGYHFDCRRIGDDLFNMYVERVFNKIRWNELRFYFDGFAFSQWAAVLHFVSRNATDADAHLIPSPEEARYMCGILRGKSGFDIKFAVDPLIGPDRDIGPPRKEILDSFDRAFRLRNRSIVDILSGKKKQPRSSEVWDQLRSAAPVQLDD